MQLNPETLARHADLSPIQVRFLEFAAQNPDCFATEAFASLAKVDTFLPYVPQPWPLFLESRRFEEMGRVALAICRLIKQVPQRVFANDPRRLAEFFGLSDESARLISALIAKTDCLDGAVGRGDFLGSPDELKCCEFNMAGNLGGWQIVSWEERYLALPVLRRFLAENGLTGRMIVPILELFALLVDEARGHGLAADGVLDTAVAIDGGLPPEWEAYFDRHYRAILAEEGFRGSLRVCHVSELREDKGRLLAGGRPVQAVIDTVMGQLGSGCFVAQLAGAVRIFNGALTQMLSDKLHLTLLSELADTDLWSAEEKETIRKHIPWSRQVGAEFTDFRGERVYLPDLLSDERDGLVLKLGASMQGVDVHLGRRTPEARWSELVETALSEPGWLVQERVDTPSYVFLSPEGEALPHEIVWGLFTIGPRFGGGYLRMIPEGRSRRGVINNAQGARGGPILSVEPAG